MGSGALTTIKVAHTAIWALFAGCTLAIPIASQRGQLRTAAGLAAIVAVEVVIMLANKGVCPLRPIAARWTDDRSPNFDIYIPAWLARYNTLIFGALYIVGVGVTVGAWWRDRRAGFADPTP